MKQPLWIAMVAASALWAPTFMAAQEASDEFLMSPDPISQSVRSERYLDDDSTLPSRQVPGLSPPRSGQNHPITPDEAWPQLQSPAVPAPSPMEPDATPTVTDRLPLNPEQPASADPPEGSNEESQESMTDDNTVLE